MVLESLWTGRGSHRSQTRMLYYHGPIDRYLKVVSGHPVNDVIAIAREGVRAKLRSAVQRALHENTRLSSPAAGRKTSPPPESFSIVVIPTPREREDLLLVCFVEGRSRKSARSGSTAPLMFLGSSNSNGSSRRQKTSSRAPSVTLRSRAKSGSRSTRRRCPSTRNIKRRRGAARLQGGARSLKAS